MSVTYDDIAAAAAELEGRVSRTPTVGLPGLSRLAGASVVGKLENLQVTGSFKARGALIKLASLDKAQATAGVVAASAGNHAQGVAYHAGILGIPAVIHMPEGTPFTKVSRTEELGAEVVLSGTGVKEAREAAEAYAAEHGMTFVHPYDDPLIVAGQGTVAKEMLEDGPELDALVVPIGGGGLMSGCAVAARALRPGLEIVGVQSALYPSMVQALGGEQPTGGGKTLAEGIAVKEPGKLTREIIRSHVDDIVLVDEPTLERAVQACVEAGGIVAEGAGAAGLAAVMADPDRFHGKRIGIVFCGANIDSRLLSSVLMRGLVREGRLVRLRIHISDVPGTLATIAGIIGDAGGNIVEVYHQRLFRDVPVKEAEVDVALETLGKEHVREIIEALEAAGLGVRLLGDTSLA